jgi:hypothetical protein
MRSFDLSVHTPQPGQWAPVVTSETPNPAVYRRVVAETGDRYLLPAASVGRGQPEKRLPRGV